MDFADYLAARDSLAGAGAVLTWLLGALGAVLIAAGILEFAGRGERLVRMLPARILPAVTLAVQAAGFLLLAWFHLEVRRTVPLTMPGTDQVLARYALPLWIEGEKLYFWALWFGVFALIVHRRQPAFRPAVDLAWGVLLLLALALTNPFTDPLPRFHQEVVMYRDALLAGNPMEQVQVLEMLYGRLAGFYNSAYMWIHPPLLFVAYAALLVSFLASIPPLLGRGGSLHSGLAYGYARLGYLLLTVGLLIGYPWTREAWKDQPWWWDPKINMTLVMWVLYTAFLHAHLYRHRPGMARLAAGLGVVSFLALIFTYVTTYVIPGVHSYQ